MYKNYRYHNAEDNTFSRWGRKAQQKLAKFLEPSESGWISVPCDGGDYWTFGTSNGKFGEFAKFNGVCYSVNKGGFAYAKAGTEKGDNLVAFINQIINEMKVNCEGEGLLDSEGFFKDDEAEAEFFARKNEEASE